MQSLPKEQSKTEAMRLSSRIRATLMEEKVTHHFDLSQYHYYFCRKKDESDADIIENAYHQTCRSFQNELLEFIVEKYSNRIKSCFTGPVLDHLRQCCRHTNKETAFNELYEIILCPSVELLTRIHAEINGNPRYKPILKSDSVNRYHKRYTKIGFRPTIREMEKDLNKLSNRLCSFAYDSYRSIAERIILRIEAIEKGLPLPEQTETIESYLYRVSTQIRSKNEKETSCY